MSIQMRYVALAVTLMCCNQNGLQGKPTFSRVSLQHREHKGLGFDEGYSTLALFISPHAQEETTSFFDARLHVFNDAYLASNLGMGARFASLDYNYAVGFNAYYDYRQYKSLSTHQLASGIEILSRRIDLRINGYYPFSGTYQDYPLFFSHFHGHNAFVKQKVLYALPCAEAELGVSLPQPFDEIGLYLGLGYYYLFKQRGFNRSIGNAPGAKVRLQATPIKYLSFAVDYTYDRLFKGRANGFISLNIPFGIRRAEKHGSRSRNWIDIQTQEVVRNEIIPVLQQQHRFVHRGRGGDPFHFLFVNNQRQAARGVGEGTFEDPYATLALAEKNSLPGDFVYIFFGDGTHQGYDTGFEMKPHQTLLGSGTEVELANIIIPALTPGDKPQLTNTEGAVVRAISTSAVEIHGMHIEGQQDAAVYMEDTALVLKNNEVVAAPVMSAFKEINPRGEVIIQNNVFYGHGGDAVVEISRQEGGGFEECAFTDNQLIATEGQNALDFKGMNALVKVEHNEFIGKAPLGAAMVTTVSANDPCEYIYKDNRIKEGFFEGIRIDGDSLARQQVYMGKNLLGGGTLVSGIVYAPVVKESQVAIIDNIITVMQEGVVIKEHEGSESMIDIQGNTIKCYSGAYGISAEMKGKSIATIEDNFIEYAKNLKGEFSGIYYMIDNRLDATQISMINNQIVMHSDNEGIMLDCNSTQESAQAIFENNHISTKQPAKGISIHNREGSSLEVELLRNYDVTGFSMSNKGQLKVHAASEDELKQENNPQGYYSYEQKGAIDFSCPSSDLGVSSGE